jgi:NAD(P) transhydrogenase subunit alpha
MRPGSVVVDMAASELGGNVELSEPDKTTVLAGGVTLIGAGSLPSAMATAASTAYARNISALLTHLVRDAALVIDPGEEIQAGVVVTHRGEIVNPAVAAALDSTSEGVS